jgi:hypothetical protein
MVPKTLRFSENMLLLIFGECLNPDLGLVFDLPSHPQEGESIFRVFSLKKANG